MARPLKNTKLIYFKYNEYYHDILMSVKKVLPDIKKVVLSEMKYRAKSLPYKTNPVKIVKSGSTVVTTSDAQRRDAVIQSIGASRVEREVRDTLRLHFYALNKNFKESHIGIYYEYGTGEKADEAPLKIQNLRGSINRYRTGKAIVSRSKHINYAGIGNGKWYDMGGNIRITGSPKAGVNDAKFRSYIGEDIEPKYWFSGALKARQEYIKARLRKAISIKLDKYLVLRPTFILGRD